MEGKGVFQVVLLLFSIAAISAAQKCPKGSPKLFVFGDSYVDTGNWPKNVSGTWKEPFGLTFPGKPDGRASDGRVLTDHIASFLGIESPTPYQLMKDDASKNTQQGLNFAYGGSGVFPTTWTWTIDSMTAQINHFDQVLKENEYSQRDLDNSIALVSTGANDYQFYFTAMKGFKDGLPAFTERLVNELAADLQRINHLGVKKIAVATLPPLGCLPLNTIPPNSYQSCDEEANKIAMIHNQLLQKAVEKLNTDDGNKCTFVILDLYNAMVSAIAQFRQNAENTEYKNPLQPCCFKIVDHICSVDGVCANPKSSFFFDLGHPSDNGWNAIYSFLQGSLNKDLRV
ncbi:hypothetical protein SADUNF_Sadunf10G0184200 [Salix dunnii]|uniref:GDSL esterase/lipase n=1 Tax=Salix dunnii TaxID=1413687 RepID=A0A835JT05_9ROSI|nr:hypothetical protein SADUNF_Sadunf10G0184200 [Salix dunnii]